MNLAWYLLALILTRFAGQEPTDPANFAADRMEVTPIDLREAMSIALGNSGLVRVAFEGDRNLGVPHCFGGRRPEDDERLKRVRSKPRFAGEQSIVVEPANAEAGLVQITRQANELVLSVEQAYWNLSRAHAARWAAPFVVDLGHGRFRVEQGNRTLYCRAGNAELAEARHRAQQLQQTVASCNADVIASERRLRKFLGLPPFDGRWLVPVRAPIQDRVITNWEVGLGAVMPAQLGSLPRAPLDTLHAIVEVESAYIAYDTAKNLRVAADERFDAQRPYWEEGRMTASRCLTVVEEYATLVASERRQLAAYNSAITIWEACRGNLLAKHDILIECGAPVASHAPMETR